MTTTKRLAQTQPEARNALRSDNLIKVEGQAATVDLDAAKNAFGSSSEAFIEGFVLQLVNAGKSPDQKATAFAASVVSGIQPKDQIEALLATQMAAVHNATMVFARRLAHVENIAQQDSAERAFNKLARTFATQVEALKRYRTGGQQKMTVEHVHVGHAGSLAWRRIEALIARMTCLPAPLRVL
jgi:hypothetical protein